MHFPVFCQKFIDFSLKTIDKIKSIIISPNSSINITETKKKFESDLQLSMNIIIKPIIVISENKYSKFNLSCVLILKKLITYNYITDNDYNTIINGVNACGFPNVPVDYGYRDSKNFWYSKFKKPISYRPEYERADGALPVRRHVPCSSPDDSRFRIIPVFRPQHRPL